jgi:ribA/ribD-fused uncharacterized protein
MKNVKRKGQKMKCDHEEFTFSRDGKECRKCGLSWHLVEKELLKKALDKKQYFSEQNIPEYAVYSEKEIKGFFGKYRFLSNFFPCPLGIWYEGLKYPSTEHAYQAAKVDSHDRLPFTTCNAKEVKRLGGSVLLDKEEWEKIKYDVMLQLVTQKFAIHKGMRQKLLETGEAYLEETNHWKDQTWGVYEGKGENKLGKILMVVRGFWQ